MKRQNDLTNDVGEAIIEIYFIGERRAIKMLRRFLKSVIDYGICIYLVLILAVMPFFNREGYEHIGTDKSYFFNTVTVNVGKILIPAAVVYLVVTWISQKREFWSRLRQNVTLTDLFAAGYGLALFVSWLLSEYRSNALWGAKGWYMGFFPQMFLLLIYFFVSKLWKPRPWMLYLALGASAAVFLLGYLNRFEIDPLHMATDNSSFISTIGNINWYCGYLVSIFFAGVVLLWKCDGEKLWQKILLMLYVAVGFGTLVTQGSDSGMVALAVVMLVLFVMSAPDRDRMIMFWEEALLLGVVCLITYAVRKAGPDQGNYHEGFGLFLISGWRPFFMTVVSLVALVLLYRNRDRGLYPEKGIRILSRVVAATAAGAVPLVLILAAINTARPGSLGPLSEYSLFTFSMKWGSNRGATWTMGWKCFVEQNWLHKMVGVGPDSMPEYIYRDGSEDLLALVKDVFANRRLSNAHNEWLTVLVNTGIMGLTTFAGMMISAIRSFLREGRKNKLVCACGFCMLAYTVNNIFSFQQAMSVATIFVIFGMGSAFLQEKPQQEKNRKKKPQKKNYHKKKTKKK